MTLIFSVPQSFRLNKTTSKRPKMKKTELKKIERMKLVR